MTPAWLGWPLETPLVRDGTHSETPGGGPNLLLRWRRGRPGPEAAGWQTFRLGAEDGKLQAFKSFKQRAIDPAVLEVNGLGEFGRKVEPSAYAGRKVTAVRLSWWAKNLDEREIVLNELRFSRVGRRARTASLESSLMGKVVTLAPAGLPFTPPQDVAAISPLPATRMHVTGGPTAIGPPAASPIRACG